MHLTVSVFILFYIQSIINRLIPANATFSCSFIHEAALFLLASCSRLNFDYISVNRRTFCCCDRGITLSPSLT